MTYKLDVICSIHKIVYVDADSPQEAMDKAERADWFAEAKDGTKTTDWEVVNEPTLEDFE